MKSMEPWVFRNGRKSWKAVWIWLNFLPIGVKFLFITSNKSFCSLWDITSEFIASERVFACENVLHTMDTLSSHSCFRYSSHSIVTRSLWSMSISIICCNSATRRIMKLGHRWVEPSRVCFWLRNTLTWRRCMLLAEQCTTDASGCWETSELLTRRSAACECLQMTRYKWTSCLEGALGRMKFDFVHVCTSLCLMFLLQVWHWWGDHGVPGPPSRYVQTLGSLRGAAEEEGGGDYCQVCQEAEGHPRGQRNRRKNRVSCLSQKHSRVSWDEPTTKKWQLSWNVCLSRGLM